MASSSVTSDVDADLPRNCSCHRPGAHRIPARQQHRASGRLSPGFLAGKIAGLTFDVALHAGTLVAVSDLFLPRLGADHRPGLRTEHRQRSASSSRIATLLWLLAAASIPIGIVGYLFDKQADTTWRHPYVIGTMLILIGILMWIAERRRVGSKSMGTSQMGGWHRGRAGAGVWP